MLNVLFRTRGFQENNHVEQSKHTMICLRVEIAGKKTRNLVAACYDVVYQPAQTRHVLMVLFVAFWLLCNFVRHIMCTRTVRKARTCCFSTKLNFQSISPLSRSVCVNSSSWLQAHTTRHGIDRPYVSVSFLVFSCDHELDRRPLAGRAVVGIL